MPGRTGSSAKKCSELEALHILDRFHIVAKMNLRARMRRASSARTSSRALLRFYGSPAGYSSNAARISATSSTSACAISSAANLKTVRAYLLKEAFPAAPGLKLTRLGRQVPGRVAPPNHALPHRAHEDHTLAPGADPQLLPGAKADFQRRCGGAEQQSQSHHERILRVSHVPSP